MEVAVPFAALSLGQIGPTLWPLAAATTCGQRRVRLPCGRSHGRDAIRSAGSDPIRADLIGASPALSWTDQIGSDAARVGPKSMQTGRGLVDEVRERR